MIKFCKKIFKNIKWVLLKSKLKKCGNDVKVGSNLFVREPGNIEIGNNVKFGNNCKLESWEFYNGVKTGFIPLISINDNVTITTNSYISCANKVVIGKGTLLGENVFITDNYHGKNTIDEINVFPANRKLYSKGPVHIGKNVWIGRNACVMPNVSIGDYAVIGANAVVTHDIPAYAIAAGVPAKVIKMIN